MADTKESNEVYSPPKRRDPNSYQPLDAESSELLRKVQRRQFRRSEHTLIKLEERLKKMGCKSEDSEDEDKEEDSVSAIKTQNNNSGVSEKPIKENEADTPTMAHGQNEEGKQYNLAMLNMHSINMNKNMSLIENVQKNYRKYIRPSVENLPQPSGSPIPRNNSDKYSLSRFKAFTQESSSYERSPSETRSSSGLIKNYNCISAETSGEEKSLCRMTERRSRSNSCPNVMKNSKKQRVSDLSSSKKDTRGHWKKASDLIIKKKNETGERWRKIREIHEQVTADQPSRIKSVSLPRLNLEPLSKNAEFYEEMRIITEALKAINLRLDCQLKMLNGDRASSRFSKNSPVKAKISHVTTRKDCQSKILNGDTESLPSSKKNSLVGVKPSRATTRKGAAKNSSIP